MELNISDASWWACTVDLLGKNLGSQGCVLKSRFVESPKKDLFRRRDMKRKSAAQMIWRRDETQSSAGSFKNEPRWPLLLHQQQEATCTIQAKKNDGQCLMELDRVGEQLCNSPTSKRMLPFPVSFEFHDVYDLFLHFWELKTTL